MNEQVLLCYDIFLKDNSPLTPFKNVSRQRQICVKPHARMNIIVYC